MRERRSQPRSALRWGCSTPTQVRGPLPSRAMGIVRGHGLRGAEPRRHDVRTALDHRSERQWHVDLPHARRPARPSPGADRGLACRHRSRTRGDTLPSRRTRSAIMAPDPSISARHWPPSLAAYVSLLSVFALPSQFQPASTEVYSDNDLSDSQSSVGRRRTDRTSKYAETPALVSCAVRSLSLGFRLDRICLSRT
jgi:hypothetical protein